MLEAMVSLVKAMDFMPQPILDVILLNIIEPHKTQQRKAYQLAVQLIKRASASFEEYVQKMYNKSVLFLYLFFSPTKKINALKKVDIFAIRNLERLLTQKYRPDGVRAVAASKRLSLLCPRSICIYEPH